jgi:alkaline phosphatase D
MASCQHYEAGHYTAYQHMAREDVDLVVHLGDYIYEGAPRENQPRRHTGKKLTSLEDYRNRYALYKSDPALQRIHAAAPWIVTWDDHEVENNYAADVSERPLAVRANFLRQRAAAYRAYYEHMPLRRSSLPSGPGMQLYRALGFGQLASFAVLDTRQYRSPQVSGGKRAPQGPDALREDRSLLGATQRNCCFRTSARRARRGMCWRNK